MQKKNRNIKLSMIALHSFPSSNSNSFYQYYAYDMKKRDNFISIFFYICQCINLHSNTSGKKFFVLAYTF